MSNRFLVARGEKVQHDTGQRATTRAYRSLDGACAMLGRDDTLECLRLLSACLTVHDPACRHDECDRAGQIDTERPTHASSMAPRESARAAVAG